MINITAIMLIYQLILFSLFFALGLILGTFFTLREKKRLKQKKPTENNNIKEQKKESKITKEEEIKLPKGLEEGWY